MPPYHDEGIALVSLVVLKYALNKCTSDSGTAAYALYKSAPKGAAEAATFGAILY